MSRHASALATSPRWLSPLLLAAAALLLWLGIGKFWPWLSDDAFIALRYSQRLVDGHGLTWDDSDRVEGYSNLLWLLLCAALRPAGFDWLTIATGLGVVATVGTFALLAYARPLGGHAAAGRAPVLVLAALAPVSLWAIGGLEGPVAMLLTTAGYLALARALGAATAATYLRACRTAGFAFFWLALCRSEGPLWGGVATLGVWLWPPSAATTPRLRWRGALWILLPMLVAVLGQLWFRHAYYGEWVPNTAHAKVAVSAQTLAVGSAYLASAGRILRSLLLPALLGTAILLWRGPGRRFALCCLAALSAWALYIAAIGGDWYPLCRYLQGAYGPLVLLAGFGARAVAAQRGGAVLAWAVALLCVGWAVRDQQLDPNDPYQRVSRWEWQGRAAGEWLGQAFATEQPRVAVDAAGAVPFFSGLPALDMLGLCDRVIAKSPPPRPDHVFPAHSRGNAAHVLELAPDLMLFGNPLGEPLPRWPGGWQLEEQAAFLDDYRLVMLRTGPWPVVGSAEPMDLKLTARVRIHGRLGLQQHGAAWRVPGLLLASHRQPVPIHFHEAHRLPEAPEARLRTLAAAQALQTWWQSEAAVGVFDAKLRSVVAEVRQPTTLVLDQLDLPPGRYRVTPEPETAPFVCALRAADGTELPQVEAAFVVPPGGALRLTAQVQPGTALPVHLHAVWLRPQ
ncbi:MAG: hypothetical protein JNK49_16165 [Planctomycetes bacterium]|nr:hypothetical protein [Planctomycetota bacterium]